MNQIQEKLLELKDEKYGEFQKKLVLTTGKKEIIGVRTPKLRAYAKELYRDGEQEEFLRNVPHSYFEEDQLHAFLIAEEKDYQSCVAKLQAFLPYVDNWATCDQMTPKVFKKHKEELFEYIPKWLTSAHTYTVRFGIKMLMDHFLSDDVFDIAYPKMVSKLRSEEYYVNMMIAWYFATALAKQYEAVLPFLEGHKLDVWAHNKTIQKAVESYRITPEQKEYLRTLKIKSR